MSFLKKHYEKLILGVVLLGLFGASAWLAMQVGQFKNELTVTFRPINHKDREPIDLTTNATTLVRADKGATYKLDGEHNVFNPFEWQKATSGEKLKIDTPDTVGAGAVRIAAIRPLYLRIAFKSVQGDPPNYRYEFEVSREASKKRSDRRTRSRSVQVGRSNDMFRLARVLGSPDNPTAFHLILTDNNREITVNRNEPFELIEGWAADLEYSPERKSLNDARKDDTWRFAGDEYKIVAINENEIVLSAKSSLKRTTIELNKDTP